MSACVDTVRLDRNEYPVSWLDVLDEQVAMASSTISKAQMSLSSELLDKGELAVLTEKIQVN